MQWNSVNECLEMYITQEHTAADLEKNKERTGNKIFQKVSNIENSMQCRRILNYFKTNMDYSA